MAEESFAVVEIYVSLEAAMGMMAANRDESPIVVFVCLFVRVCDVSEHD